MCGAHAQFAGLEAPPAGCVGPRTSHWLRGRSIRRSSPQAYRQGGRQPLRGLRVLDLSRVLAGPVAGRFLAAYGADVLRIDPPQWDEPGVVPEVTLGKRCAGLDLRMPDERRTFEELLRDADVLVHGYRPGALARLGYDGETLRVLNPRLLDVSLNAYGWSGPWAQRRGFDSLVQMSCGIAEHAMRREHAHRPVPLPVQALDHATGYLMAAAVLRALAIRQCCGKVLSAKLSLPRVAGLLLSTKRSKPFCGLSPVASDDFEPRIEETAWGRRVSHPLSPAHPRFVPRSGAIPPVNCAAPRPGGSEPASAPPRVASERERRRLDYLCSAVTV